MRTQTFLIAVLMSLSLNASAENYIVSHAYEIAVSGMRLPASVSGSIAIKKCESCDVQTIRVTSDTRYVLNNRDVPLADFKRAVSNILDKQRNIATVIHHLRSDTIVAVRVVE